MKRIIFFAALFLVGSQAFAKVYTTTIIYKTHGTEIIGLIGANAGDTMKFTATCNYGDMGVPCLVTPPTVTFGKEKPQYFKKHYDKDGEGLYTYTAPESNQYTITAYPEGFGPDYDTDATIVSREKLNGEEKDAPFQFGLIKSLVDSIVRKMKSIATNPY